MDGWIELSGCGKWMWMWIVESGKVDSGLSGCGCGKWKVEGGAVPDLTYAQVHSVRRIGL